MLSRDIILNGEQHSMIDNVPTNPNEEEKCYLCDAFPLLLVFGIIVVLVPLIHKKYK